MIGGSAVNNAHPDLNSKYSVLGVIGTLGTSDVRGTSLTLPVGVQKDTGALYVWLAGTDVSIGGGGGGGGGTTISQPQAAIIDTSNSGTIYFGFAVPGASAGTNVWQIKRQVSTGGTQDQFTFADGDANYDNIWNNRGTYTYS